MKEAAVAVMGEVMCRFSAPHRGPCLAYAYPHDARGYCSVHEEIYIHDCAVAYKRKARRDERLADRWAESMRVPVGRIKKLAATLPKGARFIGGEIQ